MCGMPANAAKRDVHVALDWRKERLQPFIRGRVRKVAGEDLPKELEDAWHVVAQ